MSFTWPALLSSLLLVPLLAALYLRVQRRRRAVAERYGALGLARGPGGSVPGWRRHLPAALFLPALAMLCVALARPQATLALPRLEGTVILVVDVSGSMAADDLAPSRLEAAKAAARAFVERQPPTVRVGVVAFSDGGLAVQTPTASRPEILEAIERLQPQRGTSLGEGMRAALITIAADAAAAGGPTAAPQPDPQGPDDPAEAPPAQYPSAAIVLLSDGENNARPEPLELALAAAELGVRIYTVGMGSAAGVTLELEGFSVHTRLDEAALQQIAQLTGGAYIPAEASLGLSALYDQLATALVVRAEPTEITAPLAGAALLLLLAGGLCSFVWFNRLI